MVDLAHARAAANHVVVELDFGAKALVFAAEAFELAGIFDGDRGKARDGGEQLEVIVGETRGGIAGVEIDQAERLCGRGHRNAE